MIKRNLMTTLAVAAMTLLAAACADDYDDSALWDKVNDHEERIAALEKWQEQTNQSIAAMQELLNTTDMITGVSAVTESGETVGYTITFLHSDPITIYNGAKGADGKDGADGQTPQIGLAQAADGNWYWTLNGETLTDADGNPIRANGLDGADGEDGEDGATGPEGPQGDDGTSAPTPQIQLGSSITSGTIETDNGKKDNNAWYLSVDDGKTWYRVSGTDGTNGDTWFAEAPEKVGNYYLFTLVDQSTFRVAAYQPFCILAKGETIGTFDNATVPVNEATTLYLSIDEGIEYSSIVAQVTPVDDDAVLTRAGTSDWSVKVAKDGEDITVTVTPGSQPYALLDVSLLLTDGSKLTASRLLTYDYTIDDQGTYHIFNEQGLLAWNTAAQSDLSLNCTLEDDIDLSGTNWTPIGIDYNHQYTGTFEGNGKTITGLTVTGSDLCAGLFGYIGSGGKVMNVKLEGVQIESDNDLNDVGGVAGSSYGNIEYCSVSGSVSGSSYVGGVVGVNYGTVTGCTASGDVTGTNAYVGGVAGYNYFGGTVTACTASGDVTGMGNNVGGVVGWNYGSVTACCHVSGSVSGSARVGGVAGHNSGSVTACTASGSVEGSSDVGGVVGWNYVSSSVTACYWSDYAGNGIGTNYAVTSETTLVNGTDVTWQTAVEAMNSALQSAGSEWRYELGDEGLPVLTQQP